MWVAVTRSNVSGLLHEMITAHFLHTGSRNAKRILDAWEAMLPKFVKVMPTDYKRVLEERKRKVSAVH